MDYMAGSVSAIRQYYFVNSATAQTWNDPTTTTDRLLSMNQRELSMFFKDDWKVNSSLTLNLGLRWDYFGLPWVDNGLTAGLKGGAMSLFGGSAGGFGSWLQSPSFNSANLTVQQFIGPGSPNPNQQPYNKDYTNFGPAVGFAWQLPWFGKGKTTLRGGYQVSYVPIASSDPNVGYGAVIGNVAGTINPVTYSGDAAINSGYLDMTNLQSLIPVGSIPTQGTTLANLIPAVSAIAGYVPRRHQQSWFDGVRPQHPEPVHSEPDDGFDAQRRIQRHGGRPVYRDLEPEANRHVSPELGQLDEQWADTSSYDSARGRPVCSVEQNNSGQLACVRVATGRIRFEPRPLHIRLWHKGTLQP